jgi:centrosomal CEP192-like protein
MRAFTSRRRGIIAALTVLAALLLAVPATAAACGPEAPPVITNAKATPGTLPWEGGTIRVEAEVTEPGCGVVVWLEIVSSDGNHYPSQMLPTEETVNDNPRTYRAEFGAPANPGTTVQKYSVTIFAEDQDGQRASASAGTVKVAGRPGPLSIEIERTGAFGNVTVGRTATRVVSVHNPSPTGSKWIKASLSVASAPFYLRNAVGGKIDFTIGPGETRRFWLDFKPTAAGPASGSLTLSRPDGAQPPISLGLSGKGVPPVS